MAIQVLLSSLHLSLQLFSLLCHLRQRRLQVIVLYHRHGLLELRLKRHMTILELFELLGCGLQSGLEFQVFLALIG